jgi:GntR family transcriptional regulator, rspAB operon transcriptional repressor
MAIDPAEIHRVAPLQVKDLVYERLREALVDLTFEPGQPLREAALVERLGVSKTPIREALVRLERDGLVEIAPYRGARARSYSLDDLHEFYEVRAIVESECVRRAAERPDNDGIGEALTSNVAAGAAALARGDLGAVTASLAEFDELLLAQVCNAMIADLLRRLQAHLRRLGPAGDAPDRLRWAVADHQAIAAAILRGDGPAAQDLHRLHLQHLLDERLRTATPPA